MKPKYFLTHILLVLSFLAYAIPSSAKSWRINNNVAKNPKFTDINAAMTSNEVVAGDTLYLDPGCTLSEAQTISKQVTIVGPGYNAAGQTTTNYAFINGILTIDAIGTIIQGVAINNTLNINAAQVLINRCSLQQVNVNAQYGTVRQCTIFGYQILGTNNNTSAYFTLENSIMYYYGFNTIQNFQNANITNNYIEQGSSSGHYGVLANITNSVITNNIILESGNIDKTLINVTGIITNNIISGNAAPQDGNMMVGTRYTTAGTLFTSEGTFLEQGYRLKEDSPAKGFGVNGVDCGPYGGMYPFVPGGIPKDYPYYTKFSVSPQATDNIIKVSLNVKMQDE